MARKRYATTIQERLLEQARTVAKKQKSHCNDVLEQALQLYFQMQGTKILEKEVAKGKYQTITIFQKGMSLDYVDKRITLDVVSDIDTLLQNGYYLVWEIE